MTGRGEMTDARVPLDVAAKWCVYELDGSCDMGDSSKKCNPGDSPCVFEYVKEPLREDYVPAEVFNREAEDIAIAQDAVAKRVEKLEAAVYKNIGGTPVWVTTTPPMPEVEYLSVDESKSKSYWLLEMDRDEVKYLGTYTNAEIALVGAAQSARWEVIVLEVYQNMPMKATHYWRVRSTGKWEVDPVFEDDALRYGDTL
jgi:hypothetical protein